MQWVSEKYSADQSESEHAHNDARGFLSGRLAGKYTSRVNLSPSCSVCGQGQRLLKA